MLEIYHTTSEESLGFRQDPEEPIEKTGQGRSYSNEGGG